jgi:type II secretory pathway component GspD/PulD (secretin)
MKITNGFALAALAGALITPAAMAQPTPVNPPADLKTQTFYLKNVSQASDANEIYTALRNMLHPQNKSYLIPSQNSIMVQAPPDQLALAQQIINDLDRPKRTYRLTYTITEMDGAKKVGTQHFAMVVASGQSTKLKQGSKVPVATGSYAPGTATQQTQFTYLDIGMNFEASLDEFANGVRLKSNVEQLSIAEEKSGVGPQDPIVRQTSLTGASFLTPGKPQMLGSVDIPGSTRHVDVEVVMEQLQ